MPEPAGPVDPAASGTPLPPPPPPRIWPVYVVTAGLLLGMILLSAFIVTGLAVLSRPEVLGGGTLPGLLWTAAVSVAWIGAVTLAVAVMSPLPLAARLGLGPPRLTRTGWVFAIVGGLALSQGIDLLLRLSGLGRGDSLELMIEVLGRARGGALVAAVLIIGVGAGIVEELFFRGYAQRRLVARYGASTGIVIAAVLFALAHGDPRHAAFAFGFGVFVGAIAHWSESTGPAIAVHVANNVVSVLTIAGGFDGFERVTSRGALALACVALFAGAFACARAVRRRAAQWTATRPLG